MYKLSKIIAGALAQLYMRRFNPVIIGVTGNAGKTSAKEMIGAVVGKTKKVRIAKGNLNNEVGLPFNIISDDADEYYEKGGSLIFGIKTFFKALFGLLSSDYPEVLVLEYGADSPGDIRRLALAFKPHVSVLTTVGDVPVHVEFFKDADALADEKANLVRVLGAGDFAVLNHDDSRVLGMKSQTKARVSTYGFNNDAVVRASDVEYVSNEEGQPLGVTFKLNHGPTFVPVRVDGSLGKSQALTAAAAAAVGLALGMNLVEISEALHGHHSPNGRLKILKGIKHSNIIDDTYNASPASTRLALETLRDVPSLRKIAVLGDMLELGEYTEEAHKEIGRFAGENVNVLVCVGARAKFIAETASEKLSPDNVFTYTTSEDAKLKVQDLIREHDLILVKGSQGIRMEKIVEEIVAEPQLKKDLLVRQSKKWTSK
jgi:UDP-N-acetylmuramoyl-tripeptide--D-alanyl-D-alanine ligase